MIKAVMRGRPITKTRTGHKTIVTIMLAVDQAIDDLTCYANHAPGYTYALRSVNGLIKIGSSMQPVERIKDIQSVNGSPIELLGLCHDALVEQVLHIRHSAHRAHGEWFEINDNPIPTTPDPLTCFTCTKNSLSRKELGILSDIRSTQEAARAWRSEGRREGDFDK